MTDSDLPHGIFDAEAYYLHEIEVAEKRLEWARRNLRNLGSLAIVHTEDEPE